MNQFIPLELDDGTIVHIQSDFQPSSSNQRSFEVGLPNSQTLEKQDEKTSRSFQSVQNLIRSYTVQTLKAFQNLSMGEVSEITLEFGVGLDGKAEIPFIVSGTTNSNLKITVKCLFPRAKEE